VAVRKCRTHRVAKRLGLKLCDLTLSGKQIPQLVENLEVEVDFRKLWRRPDCAQGRWARSQDSSTPEVRTRSTEEPPHIA
jgi:hypothetical protein